MDAGVSEDDSTAKFDLSRRMTERPLRHGEVTCVVEVEAGEGAAELAECRSERALEHLLSTARTSAAAEPGGRGVGREGAGGVR